MSVTVNVLQAEIREVEGVDVIVQTAKPGDVFPSYKAKWPTALADDRTVKAFKRRLEHSLVGFSYSIVKRDGTNSVFPQVKMGALRAGGNKA
jgi:hypothetical protein